MKYAANWNQKFRPYYGKRLSYEFPMEHMLFCAQILRGYAATQSSFDMGLDSLSLFKTFKHGITPLRWRLSNVEKLIELDTYLREQFTPILEELALRLELGDTSHGTSQFQEKTAKSEDRFGSSTPRPHVRICSAPNLLEAQNALRQIESEYGNRFWTVKAESMVLWPHAKANCVHDPNFIGACINFPFRGSF